VVIGVLVSGSVGVSDQPPAAVAGPLDLALAVEVLEAFVDPGLGPADGVGELGNLGPAVAGGLEGGQQPGQRVTVPVPGVVENHRRDVRGRGPLRVGPAGLAVGLIRVGAGSRLGQGGGGVVLQLGDRGVGGGDDGGDAAAVQGVGLGREGAGVVGRA
jgi:hypothetical protein